MTEYGRSPGSGPWHPEDPLYGDQHGWTGRQAGGQYYQQQPQYGGGQQDPYQQGYGEHQYGAQQYGGGPQPGQQYDGQQYAGAPQDGQAYPGQAHDGQVYPQQQYEGGWDTGQQAAAMPYGAAPQPPADPYAAHGHDPYSTPEAYPPPQPPGQRRAEPDAAPQAAAAPGAEGPEEERHGFFDGDPDGDRRDDEYDEYDDDPAESRRAARDRRGKSKKRKSRNGVACLFVALVIVGGLGGVGYFGYQFIQGQFGPAPDYTGEGTSETVQVEIPVGAGGTQIGNLLLRAGVVKSVEAFTAAQQRNPKGLFIQDGFYILKKEMSAEAAVKALLDPKNKNALSIPEGKRNVWIYEQIDKRLGLPAGTTKKVAKEQSGKLGLPAWATGRKNVKDPLEGFLYPATYPVPKAGKPEDVLKKMVARANAEYGKLDLDAKAKSLKLDGPWELITVASLVQAEGKTPDDFRKMSEVVYNRLKPDNTETNRFLQFDSTFNYLKGQSEIKISESEINSNKDLYNTYTNKGLTPGPIGNPGNQALEAALNPTSDGWMYFVATDGMNKTEFAKTHDEFLRLKDKFNDSQGG
ncbi:endolytic transglycosylase MltG [Streptomyces coeruleoprunus]|uniref:Endolytic murein transglycosylase n=1 Tax=Streptomyces coeruleoprunus TaxID=285563 RepID=A0ABV9XAW0_9ACTN